MNEVQELLAENLKRLRRRLGVSQIELANMCGISNSYVGDIETGKKFPSARVIQILVDTLEVHPHELFKETTLLAAEGGAPEAISRAEFMQLKRQVLSAFDETLRRIDRESSST
jgi:transcriptional regulator with XRE-family HTH domain